MSSALARKLDEIESRAEVFAGKKAGNTVIGIRSPEGKLLRKYAHSGGEWKETRKKATFDIPEALEPILTRPKRFIVVVGGRGSGKSHNIASILTTEMHDFGYKVGCFREFQNSIEDSVHSLLRSAVARNKFDGFSVTDKAIKCSSGGEAKFRGLARNPDSVKSMDGFKRFWQEEAQTISENSLKLLTPTMREEGGQLIFSANPGSSEDPFSKRLINPFKSALDADGIYEDDLHLIIKMNWRDNPWFPAELKAEMEWDKANLSRALYDHIWEGEFNDSIEDALVMAEWFDACIDAHKKLGFKPQGARIAAHDPSDMGGDSKGFAVRHGSVVEMVEEKTTGNVNEGCDWATGLAIQAGVDWYTWDCDGMGAALNAQTNDAFKGKRIEAVMFKGSESPDRPDAIYQGESQSLAQQQKTNKDSFKNKRAQYYMELRERCYKTYRAVVHGEYADPDKLISFSSEMKLIHKLRAELCRIPVKPNANGLLELYTKPTMKAKFNLPSPNLADSVMMLMRYTPNTQSEFRMPTAIRPMGRR